MIITCTFKVSRVYGLFRGNRERLVELGFCRGVGGRQQFGIRHPFAERTLQLTEHPGALAFAAKAFLLPKMLQNLRCNSLKRVLPAQAVQVRNYAAVPQRQPS